MTELSLLPYALEQGLSLLEDIEILILKRREAAEKE